MDEDFKLTKTNKIMIFVTIVSVCIFILSLICLIFSLKDKKDEIPDLNVVKGKTSTLVMKTTKEETTTTKSTTTTRNLVSPYYDVKVNNIMSDSIYKKESLSKEEAQKVLEEYYKLYNSIYALNDYSFLDIATTVKYAKNGSIDKIEENGDKYGIIYNSTELFEKIMDKSYTYTLSSNTYNNKSVFIKRNDNYYRLYAPDFKSSMVLVSLTLKSYNQYKIIGEIKYYDGNYKEKGFTAPQYNKTEISIRYSEGKWVLNQYRYPLYE